MRRLDAARLAARRLAGIMACLLTACVQAGEQQPILEGAFTVTVPAGWTHQQPSSTMRQLQYRVAGPGGPAQFILYYFGPHQGGSAEANIARWGTQFAAPDGSPVQPSVQRMEVGGLHATVAEFYGSYARGIGMGPQSVPKPDQGLLATVVEGGPGPLIFQLYGPRQSVTAARSAYLEMVRSLRRGGGG